MTDFKRYKDFILEKESKKTYYGFVLNDIQIYVDDIIKKMEEFNMRTWFLYSRHNSVSFGYYGTSNVGDENVQKIKKFFLEHLPYLVDIKKYDDDHRLVFNFVEVGDPVKFKFINK